MGFWCTFTFRPACGQLPEDRKAGSPFDRNHCPSQKLELQHWEIHGILSPLFDDGRLSIPSMHARAQLSAELNRSAYRRFDERAFGCAGLHPFGCVTTFARSSEQPLRRAVRYGPCLDSGTYADRHASLRCTATGLCCPLGIR